MKRHFFINKSNTIFRGLRENMGSCPTVELNYGGMVSRILLKANLDEIQEMAKSGEIANNGNLHHVLKMTNCGSLDGKTFFSGVSGFRCSKKERTSSFDIIAFRLPREFDQGHGSSYIYDKFTESKYTTTFNGSNWFQSSNGNFWKPNKDTEMGIPGLDNGVYSNEYLASELKKFRNGEESVVVAEQHFDTGTENLELDLTDEINRIVFQDKAEGNKVIKNYGIGLAFSPELENMIMEETQYIGFFSGNTNTFYKPYVETTYDVNIKDDRLSFSAGRDNRLMLYCQDNGLPVNLDNIPKCTIDDTEFSVEKAGKGIYMAIIPHNSLSGGDYTMKYDIWSNLALNDEMLEDVEMSFIMNPSTPGISSGSEAEENAQFSPTVSGLNDNGKIWNDETVELRISFNRKYDMGKTVQIDECQYRICLIDGDRRRTVFDYMPADILNGSNSLVVHGTDLVPGKYEIDFKIKKGRSTRIFNGAFSFNVINDETDDYR